MVGLFEKSARPFRTISMVSMPAMRIRALQNDLSPSIGVVIRLMAGLSCSTMVLRYLHWRSMISTQSPPRFGNRVHAQDRATRPTFYIFEHVCRVKKLRPTARPATTRPSPLPNSGAYFPAKRRRHVVVEGAIREAGPHDLVVAKLREVRVDLVPLRVLC